MEEKKELESGFRIQNILLIESSFSRILTVIFDNPDIKQEANVEVNVSINENIVSVTVNLLYKQVLNEIEQVSAKISMIGVFEKFGDSPLNLEQFGKVNGAAMIYPYIREHFTNLAVKAGIGLIFLPPVNLTK
ncbi:MAG: protein-export chaperone SecB [Bacteroidaceae bacterium]|jgi:preprotein translocase subunit SecB|nr:protein-export chaperone SecB [Bacteroidaceae bacterium]MEA4975683.1 protein-export chaperone SecB [Paludibacter sp.]